MKIKTVRITKGIKVVDVAKKLGLTSMAIYHYENGKRRIPITTLKELSKIYEVDIKELID